MLPRVEHRTGRSLSWLAALMVLIVITIVPVAAATGLPADTQQGFGVGARADAMGDAFVAVANDASAAFWNPAGLSLLPTAEVTAVTKTLPATTGRVRFDNANSSEYSAYSLMNLAPTDTGNRSAGTETTFYAATIPLGKGIGRRGTLGISRALAGYFDTDYTVEGTFDITDPGTGELTAMTARTRYNLRIDHTSLTYGWRASDQMRAGLGFVMATAEGSSLVDAGLTYDEPAGGRTATSSSQINTDSTGYGFTLGTLWTPKWGRSGAWTLGASYLSRIEFSGVETAVFGNQSPDRLMFGASYRAQVPGSMQNDQVLWAMQITRSGTANADIGGDVARQAVWNFHFGGEYEVHRNGASPATSFYFPIRYGLFTNKSPNDVVYGDETWLTLGLGGARADKAWQGEFAFQHATRTSQSLYSLSGVYSF